MLKEPSRDLINQAFVRALAVEQVRYTAWSAPATMQTHNPELSGGLILFEPRLPRRSIATDRTRTSANSTAHQHPPNFPHRIVPTSLFA